MKHFNTTHGATVRKKWSGAYRSWRAMLQRIDTPDERHDIYYRKVQICRRWREFSNFLADMGQRPTGKTLDRWPDKTGNYEPSNCRWATWKQQARNRHKRKIRMVCKNGHRLIGKNLITTTEGWRYCRCCRLRYRHENE
jgi:hypothetical protein